MLGSPIHSQQQAPQVLFTAASAVDFAYLDIATVPPEKWKTTRFLSLYNIPPQERKRYILIAAFVLNSLSNNTLMIPPFVVPGTQDTLIRFDLKDYGIDPAAYDRLIEIGSGPAPFPDPYFHQVVEKEVPTFKDEEWGYHDRYGRWVRTEIKKVPSGTRKEKTLALAAWLPKDKVIVLAAQTGTANFLARLDFVIYHSMLEPRYHELLGLGDSIDDVLKLAVADKKVTDREGVQVRGAVLWSEVALHNRSLERTPTILRYGRGYYWESRDYNTSVKNQDVLVDLLDDKPDAREIIFSLRNGLQGYYVVDANGKRLDKAAANVAIDSRSPLREKEVYTARNCVACHSLGIIPIQDEVRLTATGPIALALDTLKKKDADNAKRIADRYFAIDINQLVTADQQTYAAAVKACNGLDPAANALQLQQAWVDYIDRPIGLEELALETGYPVPILRAVLERSAGTGLSHVFVGLAQTPPRKARRDQVEADFQQIQTLLLAVPVAPNP